MEGVLAVQAQRELTGQVQPHRHMLALPRRGEMLGELLDDLLAEKELEEPGFGDVGSEFDVIEAAFAKGVDHQRLVVFKDHEVHGSAPRRRRFAGPGRAELAELVNAQLDALGLECINELEQLGEPASQLHARLSALAVVPGHGAQGIEVFRRGG